MTGQVVGIDVAKASFDLSTQKPDGKRKDLGKVPNTDAGIARAMRWIADMRPGRRSAWRPQGCITSRWPKRWSARG
jgi:hypothetical protein